MRSPENCKSKFSSSGTVYSKKSLTTKGYCIVQDWCFGVLPGFETNLGVIAPPTDTIFGYVYVCGYGEKTKYALYAEAG